jgi:hypothetical protein
MRQSWRAGKVNLGSGRWFVVDSAGSSDFVCFYSRVARLRFYRLAAFKSSVRADKSQVLRR